MDKNSTLDLSKLSEKPKAQALYEVHQYAYQKRLKAQFENLRKEGVEISQPEEETFIYIHTNGEFLGRTTNKTESPSTKSNDVMSAIPLD